MRTSLRQILADSHVSAVAIVVLLIWSLGFLIDAVWNPILQAVSYLATAVAILGLPAPHYLLLLGGPCSSRPSLMSLLWNGTGFITIYSKMGSRSMQAAAKFVARFLRKVCKCGELTSGGPEQLPGQIGGAQKRKKTKKNSS